MAAAAAVTGATTAAAATVRDDRAAAGSEKMAALFQVIDIWTASVWQHVFRDSNTKTITSDMRYAALSDVLKKATSLEEKQHLAAYAFNSILEHYNDPCSFSSNFSSQTVQLLISCIKTESVSSILRDVHSTVKEYKEKIAILLEIVNAHPTDDNVAYLLNQLQGAGGLVCISGIANKLLKIENKTKSINIAKQLVQLVSKSTVESVEDAEYCGWAICAIVSHHPELELAMQGLQALHVQLKSRGIKKVDQPRIYLLPILYSVFHQNVIQQLSEMDPRLAPSCAIAQSVLNYEVGGKQNFDYNDANYRAACPELNPAARLECYLADLAQCFGAKAKMTGRQEVLDDGVKHLNAIVRVHTTDNGRWRVENIVRTRIAMARADMLLASISRTQSKT